MKIKEEDKKTLFLRTHLASCDTGKEKFNISLNIDNRCLIFEFPDKTYTVSLRSITDDVLDFRERQKNSQ